MRALFGAGGEPANEEVEQRRRMRAKLEQRGAIGRGERERGRHWSRRRKEAGKGSIARSPAESERGEI